MRLSGGYEGNVINTFSVTKSVTLASALRRLDRHYQRNRAGLRCTTPVRAARQQEEAIIDYVEAFFPPAVTNECLAISVPG